MALLQLIQVKSGIIHWAIILTLLGHAVTGEHLMLDLVMLAIAFVSFALSVAYVYACDLL